MLDALDLVDVTLHLGGHFSPPELLDEVKQKPGWKKVVFHGFASREMRPCRSTRVSRVGLATLHPVGHYPNALAVKMFEYMLAGIPVVCSDFPLWKRILEENDCGLSVDPSRPREIAKAIQFLLDHPEEARRLGENGRRAVSRKVQLGAGAGEADRCLPAAVTGGLGERGANPRFRAGRGALVSRRAGSVSRVADR